MGYGEDRSYTTNLTALVFSSSQSGMEVKDITKAITKKEDGLDKRRLSFLLKDP